MARTKAHELLQRFRQSTLKGWIAAADYLEWALRQSVSTQTGRHGPGSPPGTPPFMRTGAGLSAIHVDVIDGNPLEMKVYGGEWYMKMHDEPGQPTAKGTIQRPWLVGKKYWYRYRDEMIRILKRHARRK